MFMSYKNKVVSGKQVLKKKICALSGRLCNYALKRLLKVTGEKKMNREHVMSVIA